MNKVDNSIQAINEIMKDVIKNDNIDDYEFEKRLENALKRTDILTHIKTIVTEKLIESNVSYNEGIVLLLSIAMRKCIELNRRHYKKRPFVLYTSKDSRTGKDNVLIQGKDYHNIEIRPRPGLGKLNFFVQLGDYDHNGNYYELHYTIDNDMVKGSVNQFENERLKNIFNCVYTYGEDGLLKEAKTSVSDYKFPTSAFYVRCADIVRVIAYSDNDYTISEKVTLKAGDVIAEDKTVDTTYSYYNEESKIFPHDFLTGTIFGIIPEGIIESSFLELYNLARTKMSGEEIKL